MFLCVRYHLTRPIPSFSLNFLLQFSLFATIQAQQTSSDALKNSPFVLVSTSLNKINMDFKPNEAYAKLYATQGAQQSKINVIKIPKTIQNRAPGYVMIGRYTINETVDHMPLVGSIFRFDDVNCFVKKNYLFKKTKFSFVFLTYLFLRFIIKKAAGKENYKIWYENSNGISSEIKVVKFR